MSQEPVVLFKSDAVLVRLMTLGPREIGRQHAHSHLLETVICVEGEIALCVPGSEPAAGLSHGQQASVPPRQAHWLENRGSVPARYVLVQSGGEYDFLPVADRRPA